ncbi:hypothetical protein BRAS3809_3370028 [Bradyrhizobium sp. STM 3809]|nr:hypothetical protein BRAS3809_3370028 [Bradyrhizobium sp. STM 3809]
MKQLGTSRRSRSTNQIEGELRGVVVDFVSALSALRTLRLQDHVVRSILKEDNRDSRKTKETVTKETPDIHSDKAVQASRLQAAGARRSDVAQVWGALRSDLYLEPMGIWHVNRAPAQTNDENTDIRSGAAGGLDVGGVHGHRPRSRRADSVQEQARRARSADDRAG